MKRKLRVVHITHDLSIGGLQQVVVTICKTIDKERFEVFVLCLRDTGELAEEVKRLGVKVTLLPQKTDGTDYFSFLKVLRYLKKNKIDVIHTHNTHPFIDGTLAALIARTKLIIHTDHGRIFPDKKKYMVAEWLMSHFAYRVVGVSDEISRNLSKYEKISRKKITTISNGIDGAKYRTTINKDLKRRELSIKPNGPVVGLGARLVKEKGLTYLIKSLPKVIEIFPEISLVIAGRGPLEETLKSEVAEQNLDKHVFFIGVRHDMHELLNLFDLYVLPSISEGLPIGLLEAMAAGCPVLATDVGGISSVIKDKANGRLVMPGNAVKLGEMIIEVLSNRGVLVKYSDNAYLTFLKYYSSEIMTHRYELLYLRKARFLL